MTMYYTKDQLIKIFEDWGVKESPPPKGQKVIVAFPRPATPNLATITRDTKKSTYGKPLYCVEMQ